MNYRIENIYKLLVVLLGVFIFSCKSFALPVTLTPSDVAALPVVGSISNANNDFFRGPLDFFVRTDFPTGSPEPGILTQDTLYRVTPILFASGSGNVLFSNFSLVDATSTTIEMSSDISVSNAESNFTFSVGFYISDFLSPPFFGLFKAVLSASPDPSSSNFNSSFSSLIGLESNQVTDTTQMNINQLNTNISTVPEPAGLVLLGMGLAGLGLRRKFKA